MGQSLEIMKQQIKENIQFLINREKFDEALLLINQYATINNDAEAYSIKFVILMMQQNFAEAEIVIKAGLKDYPYNADLLFNISYFFDKKNNYSKALEYYSLAKLFNPNSDVSVNDIISDIKPINYDELNVIHGTMEIANQMYTMTAELKNIGINTKMVNYYPSYLKYESDYLLDMSSFKDIGEANIKTKEIAAKIISEYDIFHFHFGTSLTLDHSDLPLLKMLGKKIVMHYWGSDVRRISVAQKTNPYVRVKNFDEIQIIKQIKNISMYIEDCIVADYELYQYVKEFFPKVHFLPQVIDLERYPMGITSNKRPLIVHAPTHADCKGTEFILKAIEKLQQEHDFDFQLVQGMSHDKAKEIYQKADLIIDQILAGAYGLLALEGMAMGKPVVCWISEYMQDKYPKELPLISANPDTIISVLRDVLANSDMLPQIGKQGRKYMEKYHDAKIVANQLNLIYQGLR